jgi:hypothetical protein
LSGVRTSLLALVALQTALGSGMARATADPRLLAGDPAALQQLIQAVSLDVMSEAALDACEDAGAASAPQMRAAWVAWRERHQLAPLRVVVGDLKRRQRQTKSWEPLTAPMRERVLAAPAPEPVCAQLARDWQTPAMDVSTLYPQAHATALALVQAKLASRPESLALAPGVARGQVLLPSQVPALAAQHGGGWSSESAEVARRELGLVYVKGRVARRDLDEDQGFYLVQEQGDRRAASRIDLGFDAEAWVGREVVLRGLATSLRSYALRLADAALVTDASGLAPSPLPQAALARKEVLLQRVLTAPGRGLPDKDLTAVVIHGESNYSNGTRWDEDVRFLLRDGTVYHRTEMPPDQVNVAASRQLEPQRWGRWRASGKAYDMQPQDADGRPGAWQAQKHRAVQPWPKDMRLEGSFSRGQFNGSLALGGTSFKRAIRFTRDGRFERSYSSLSSSGAMAATLNNAVISASSRGDGKGSSSTGGGTVGSAGAFGSRQQDDGAGRRGRYQLSGFVLTLDYDDGHQERLLSFPVYDDHKTIYVGSGSLSLDK